MSNPIHPADARWRQDDYGEREGEMNNDRRTQRAMRGDWVMGYYNQPIATGRFEVCFIRDAVQHWYKPTEPSVARLYDVLNTMSVKHEGHYNVSRRSGWSFWLDLPR